jgi:phosphatidylethanolamine-binding protein (PEBP) family uncharacterized protein
MKSHARLIGSIVAFNSLLTGACSLTELDYVPSPPKAAGSGGKSAGAAGAAGMAVVMAPSCEAIPSQVMARDSAFKVTVAEFASCMPIPAVHTCDGQPFPQGTSPTISWTPGPTGTMSYALVLKDLAVIARTASTDANYNKGFHYVMWDIPASQTMLPPAMTGGHLSAEVPGARQWSNFNDYAYFGPCPNYDPKTPTDYNDSYAFTLYALPTATAVVPAPVMGISTVRQLDEQFRANALAVAEYRGTSNAHSSGIPDGVLPPMTHPPCPTDGADMPADCLAGP